MHPPSFDPDHRLSDWPACCLELRCPCSPRLTILPIRLLIERHGDRPFRGVLARLQCSACKGRPAPVYLVAGHNRTFMYGPPAEWSVELVPVPSSGRTGLPSLDPSGN